MGVIDLAPYKPVPATLGDANQIANGFQTLQTLLNGNVDNNNFGAGKIFDPTKLMQNAAVDRQVMAWDAASATWKPIGGALYRKATSKTVNNSVAETDLLNGEITVAAGVLGTTGMLRLSLFMDILNNSGGVASWRFKVKLGGTVVFDSGVYNVPNSGAPRTTARLQFEMLNTGAANTNVCSVRFVLPAVALSNFSQIGAGTPADAGSGEKFNISEGAGTSAIDTATAKLLEVTVTHGTAAATIETKLYGALVEIL